LVARVRALLRRASAPAEETTMSVAGLEIDPERFVVRKDGRELAVTATEFRLLLELARRPGRVFTREMLLDRVWNYSYLGDSTAVSYRLSRAQRGTVQVYEVDSEDGSQRNVVNIPVLLAAL
jgi:two-component system response regulator MtrA